MSSESNECYCLFCFDCLPEFENVKNFSVFTKQLLFDCITIPTTSDDYLFKEYEVLSKEKYYIHVLQRNRLWSIFCDRRCCLYSQISTAWSLYLVNSLDISGKLEFKIKFSCVDFVASKTNQKFLNFNICTRIFIALRNSDVSQDGLNEWKIV